MSGKQKRTSKAPVEDVAQPVTETHPPPDAAVLDEHIEQLSRERDEARDQALRALADYQNLRRRIHAEREQIRLQALEEAALAILPALDDLERALTTLGGATDVGAVLEGIRLVQKQFEAGLEKIGLKPIEAVGLPFDPSRHEAVMVSETLDQAPDTVIEELRRGYTLNGRVIRASRVRVSKAPDDTGPNE